jgi:hypothetical protein
MMAVRSLHRIRQAQVQYYAIHWRYGAAAELSDPDNRLIDPAVAREVKDGYRFRWTVTSNRYAVVATPVNSRQGRRSFYLDETGVIREDWRGIATAASEPLR